MKRHRRRRITLLQALHLGEVVGGADAVSHFDAGLTAAVLPGLTGSQRVEGPTGPQTTGHNQRQGQGLPFAAAARFWDRGAQPAATGEGGDMAHLVGPAQVNPGAAAVFQAQPMALIQPRRPLIAVQRRQVGFAYAVELPLDASFTKDRHWERTEIVQAGARQPGLPQPGQPLQQVMAPLAAFEAAIDKQQRLGLVTLGLVPLGLVPLGLVPLVNGNGLRLELGHQGARAAGGR